MDESIGPFAAENLSISLHFLFRNFDDCFNTISLIGKQAKLHPEVTYKVEFREDPDATPWNLPDRSGTAK